jgi:hypothetical protein
MVVLVAVVAKVEVALVEVAMVVLVLLVAKKDTFHKSLGKPSSHRSTPYNKLSTPCILQSSRPA